MLFDPLEQASALGEAARGSLRPTLRTTNIGLSKAMALHSRGIALIGQALCHPELQAGALQPLPEVFALPEVPIYLVMPSKRLLPPRVRAFVDHLVGDARHA